MNQTIPNLNNKSTNQKVNLDLLSLSITTLMPALLCHLLVWSCMAYFLYETLLFPIFKLWTLFLFVIDMLAIAIYLTHKYYYTEIFVSNLRLWECIRSVIIFLIIIVWSSFSLLLTLNNNMNLQFVMILIAIGFSAAFAVQGILLEIKASCLNIAVVLLPVIGWSALQKNSFNYAAAYLITVYMGFLFFLTTKGHQVLIESLFSRYKNIELSEKLSTINILLEEKVLTRTQELKIAKDEAIAANQAKTEFLGIISHELRTPLRAIDSSADGLLKALDSLIHGYQLAKSAQLPVAYLTPQQFKILPGLLNGIRQEADSAFNFIRMLLSNIGNIGDAVNFQALDCSINHCIATALARYPFSKDEKALVHWKNDKNFIFMGNDVNTN